MKTIFIVLGCWSICIAAIYITRFISSQKAENKLIAALDPPEKTKLKTHLRIIFLSPILVPIRIIIWVCQFIQERREKRLGDRPRPIKGRLKKCLKADRVLDEYGKVVSLFQYNIEHETSFTLDDIYGKGYTACLSEDALAEIKMEQERALVEIQDGLPDTPHKQASMALCNALVSDDYSCLENLLDDQCILVLNNRCSFTGKNDIVSYWKDRKKRKDNDKLIERYVVTHCPYYSNTALRICTNGHSDAYVMFGFAQGKITQMVFTIIQVAGQSLNSEGLDEIPFKVDIINSHIEEEIAPKNDRIPCLHCGTPSESLKWYRVLFKSGIHGYLGDASICPNCNCFIEYRQEVRLRYEEPVKDDSFDNLKQGQSENPIDESVSSMGNESEYFRTWYDLRKIKDALVKNPASFDPNEILKPLTSLSLLPGDKIGMYLASHEGMGDNSYFYTYNEKTNEKSNDLEGIRIEHNANGIWQWYLLTNSRAYLPAFWHGGYSHRIFIMTMKDCLYINQLKDKDLRALDKTGLVNPSVVIEEQTENRLVASVYCCYWNEWEGLVREHVRYTLENNTLQSSETIGKLILHKYDCNILF